MTPIESLDTNYGATDKEREYIKKTLETKGVKELFLLEQKNLQNKIIKNFHNDNYLNFETKKMFETEKCTIKNIISNDTAMQTKYELALKNNKEKGGFSEGILLLQAIAIKCVNILANQENVEAKLRSRNNTKYKSPAMDGILGPNTFYVLASIAKEKGISFNGIVDKALLDTMIGICGTIKPKFTTEKQLTQQEPIKITEHISEKKEIQEDKPTPTNTANETKKIEEIISKKPEQEIPKKEATGTTNIPKETAPVNTETIKTNTKKQKEDEVFTKIKKTIKEKDRAYPERKSLNEEQKNNIQAIYKKITTRQDINEATTIIENIDQSLLSGLGEIIVKKILIEKEKNANSSIISYLQEVGKIIIKKKESNILNNQIEVSI